MISYILRDSAITLVIDGNSYYLPTTHPSYAKIMKEFKSEKGLEGKEGKLMELVLNREVFEKLGKYDLVIDKVNRQIKFAGIDLPLSKLFYDDLLKIVDLGGSLDPFVEFWRKVANNPDRAIVGQIYDFMKHNDISISSSGNIIGYKSVKVLTMEELLETKYHSTFTFREVVYFINSNRVPEENEDTTYVLYLDNRFIKTTDSLGGKLTSISGWLSLFDGVIYTDFHTCKTRIKLNEPVVMSRDRCDNNPEMVCSSGLHIGSIAYAKDFNTGHNQAILACEINPTNVVSVPNDYNGQKMRCCEYVARSVVDKAFAERFVADIDLTQSNYAQWVSK